MDKSSQSGHLNHDFRAALIHINEFGLSVFPRGSETKELLNYNISLHDPRNRIINFADRKTNLKYLLGELVWYFKGSNDPSGILPYSKFWNQITNSGKVPGYEAGTINSNYGHRFFGHHEACNVDGKSQWGNTAEILKADKDSRQAIMNVHLPQDRHEGNKDVPCTLSLQFFIREDKLHLIVNMRSNDIILGFTNDVFQFTMLQEAMMLDLRKTYPELQLGTYYHNAGSMHIYSRHFEMADMIIASEVPIAEMPMIEMDAFSDDILTCLVGVEAAWQAAGAPTDFAFEEVQAFNRLTPYWQALIKMCFAEDEDALAEIFGMKHEH